MGTHPFGDISRGMLQRGAAGFSGSRLKKGTGYLGVSFALDLAGPAYLLITFFRFYIDNPLVFSGLSAFLVAYGLLLLTITRHLFLTSSAYLALATVLFISHLSTLCFTENDVFLALPKFLGNVGYASALLYRKQSPKRFLFLYALLSAFFIYHIARGTDPESIFVISRNFVSILLILYIGVYFYACDQHSQPPAVWALAFAAFFAFWASGRAGILCTLILMAGSLMVWSKAYRTVGILLLTFTVFTQSTDLGSHPAVRPFVGGYERFERLQTGSVRHDINTDYLTRIAASPRELFFGAAFDDLRVIREVGGNPHNAFISLHSSFGLFGFSAMLIVIVLAIISLMKRKCFGTLLILCVALLRSAFDIAAFHGPLDILVAYGVLYSFTDIAEACCETRSPVAAQNHPVLIRLGST